ncbi:hypothetical protein QZH45_12435 [Pseudomonas corrugata]|uniref:hypothetical protein n=1 Tax=Pseudomonas corrugata TaxID=47879 RepID=UPI0006D889DA|nr:hypothetical protein [Pseudomonas corrugata]AOE65081.1 hypothetical protein AXG94_26005 [Pseudomonas corrugata]MDU9035657.1 hypothetical protein [Pseudomonas corrugata]
MNQRSDGSANRRADKLPGPTETRTLHFNLKHCKDLDDVVLHANLREYRLERHTPQTLSRSSQDTPFLALLPQEHVTHYIEDLPVPSKRPALITVSTATTIDKSIRNTIAMYLHVPKAGRVAAREEMKKRGKDILATSYAKLARYGVTSEHLEPLILEGDFPDKVDSYVEAMEAAVAVLFHHPSLLNLSGDNGGAIPAYIKESCIKIAIANDGNTLVHAIEGAGDAWQKKVPLLDWDNKQVYDGNKPLYTSRLHQSVRLAVSSTLPLAIQLSRQEEYLRGALWKVLDGVVSSEYQGTAGSHSVRRHDQDSQWKLKNLTPGLGVVVDPASVKYDGTNMSVTVENQWLRHLGAYIEFLDARGTPVASPDSWPAASIPSVFSGTATTKYLDRVGPIDEIAGIPIDVTDMTLTFPVPEAANAVNIHLAGLGVFGPGRTDQHICILGIFMTATFEYAIPVIALVVGAAVMNTEFVTNLLKDQAVYVGILGVLATIDATIIDYALTGGVKEVLLKLANIIGPLLWKTGLKAMLLEFIAQGALEEAIPFVDIALEAVNAAITAAQLCQTTFEVLEAAPIYTSTVTRTIDLDITVAPDSQFHYFPMQATHYVVTVSYDSQVTVPTKTFSLSEGTNNQSIPVSFKGIPGGGQLKVTAIFYADNGWVAGRGATDWTPALGTDGSTLVIPNLEIKNSLPPLTKSSVYEHLEKLAYEGGAHIWNRGASPPTATATTGSDLISLTSITLAQGPASIGYAWQATHLNIPENLATNPRSVDAMYTVQNVSLLAPPEQACQPLDVGYNDKSGISYDLVSPSDGSGRNFFLDSYPVATSSDYDAPSYVHLRKVTLSYDNGSKCAPLHAGAGQSYGRFLAGIPLDDFVLHPQGYVFAISTGRSKLLRCELSNTPVADSEAPDACLLSGKGTREGLVSEPVAIAIGLDGVVMVLESGNARVQAFDIHGNPVKYFKGKSSSALVLNAREHSTFLDLDVEAKGYVYVLSYTGDGGSSDDYYMDIYTPEGDLLVSTQSVASGKLAVSLDRNVYALNYELIHGADGRPEPSISHWMPPAPTA